MLNQKQKKFLTATLTPIQWVAWRAKSAGCVIGAGSLFRVAFPGCSSVEAASPSSFRQIMLRLLPRYALRATLPCAVGVAAGVCVAAEPADEWAAPHTADPADVHADGEPAFVHADLRAIYSSLPDVHAIPESEEEVIDATGGHEGYGELTPHGTSALLRLIPLCQQADRFYDLGSGSGVVTTHLALLGFNAVGIELSPTRHAVAAAALDRVPSPHRGEAACGARLPPRRPRP